MSTEPRVPRHLTRRAVLGGVGAAGVALPAFLASGGASAVSGGGPPANPPVNTPRAVRGNLFAAAAVTPGLSYQTFAGNAFRVRQGDITWETVAASVLTGPAELYLPFQHPNGVTIRELEVYVQDVPPGGVAELRLLEASTNFETVLLPALALPGGGTPQSVARVDYNLDVDASHDQLSVNVSLDSGKLLGARLGFQDFVGLTFFPVDPSRREIDTRNIRGRLVAFETYRVALEVPPFAFALVNLTITQTVAAGFLGAFPADIAWPGTSSVNWFQTNQDTANLVVVGTDSQGGMNLYCGAGQTHVVVDLQGFYY